MALEGVVDVVTSVTLQVETLLESEGESVGALLGVAGGAGLSSKSVYKPGSIVRSCGESPEHKVVESRVVARKEHDEVVWTRNDGERRLFIVWSEWGESPRVEHGYICIGVGRIALSP